MLTMRVTGADAVASALDHAADELGDLSEPLERTGDDTIQTIREVAPVESGALRDDVRTEVRDDRIQVIGGETVPYFAVQNFGSPAKNIAGQKFMDRGEAAAEQTAAAHIDQHIDRVVKTTGLT